LSNLNKEKRMMKKIITFIFATALIACPIIAFAHEHEDKDHEMMEKDMKGRGIKHEMMMRRMQRSVVATSDGGVVIVAGNKITKYDRNLNVIKEVQLKSDEMEKMMSEEKSECECHTKNKKSSENAETKTSQNSEADHESHH
jgi:hypothetical protein